MSLLYSLAIGRFLVRDVFLLAIAAVGLAVLLGLFLGNEKLMEPYVGLIDTTVFRKLESSSASTRIYWNYKSLLAFWDTWGLGIGMGSSRSSSLIVSIISQFGVIGTIIFGALVGYMLQGLSGLKALRNGTETFAIASGARAAAFGSLITASLSGDSADPGVVFFISLAVLFSCRNLVSRSFEPLDTRHTSRFANDRWPPAAQPNVV